MDWIYNFPQYSSVIFLLPSHTETICLFKNNLGEKLGDHFTGRFSEAHITIAEFWNDDELQFYLSRIRSFCELVVPYETLFDRIVFGKANVLVLPNIFFGKRFNNFISDLHHHISKKKQGISAHISIARNLDAAQMASTYEILKNEIVDFRWICFEIHIRKFNEQTKQYSDTIEVIKFSGRSEPDLFS